SMLYTEYAYASPLNSVIDEPLNGYAINDTVSAVSDSTQSFRNGGVGPAENHNRLLNFSLGATITAALSTLRLRFASWPLHPVGYLLVFSYPLRRIWFSIMLGWLAKVVLVRFGG